MKVLISILGSILLTANVLGVCLFLETGHIELLVCAGTILMLIFFYSIIKEYLDERTDKK